MDDNTKINPLFDPATDNAEIAEDVQQRINTPLAGSGVLDEEDQTFLEMLKSLIAEKKIELYTPGSLINHEVYDKVSDEAKGKADLNAMSMLARIRDINDLLQNAPDAAYQLKNLVRTLRLQKERLEEAGGDLFII